MSWNLFSNHLSIWKKIGSEGKKGSWRSRRDKRFPWGSETLSLLPRGETCIDSRIVGNAVLFSDNVLVEATRRWKGKPLERICGYSNKDINNCLSQMINIHQLTPYEINKSPRPDGQAQIDKWHISTVNFIECDWRTERLPHPIQLHGHNVRINNLEHDVSLRIR